MDKRNNRCKDASPYDTIRKASQFLAELDLLVYEEWKEPINGIYSVYLRIDKTNIFVNGKGSSRKFALASGYGELMERLQNMVYFRFSLYYDEILENNNVLIEQEDVLTEEVRMCANQNRWWNINGASEEMNQKIYEVWRNYYQTFNRKIRNAEYINIFNSKDKICIPYKMAEYYYGTNGMAAGNSLEETMVQALSEILERYAIKKCIEEKIRVPDITEYACKKYAFVNEARLEFESYGYRLHIKDLSVIDGIPGISVVICNNSFKYFVATGVHPVEEIAIERTITEICQGKDMNRLDFLINALNPQRISKYKTKNLTSIYVGRGGVYPTEFFLGASENKTQGKFCKCTDNNVLCRWLKALVEKLGFTIFMKNVTISEIHSIHIVVPGMSEINLLDDIVHLKRNFDYEKACKLFMDISDISDTDVQFLIEFLETTEDEITLNDFIQAPLSENELLLSLDKNILLCMLYIKVKNYKSAKKSLDIYLENVSQNRMITDEMIDYYSQLSIILAGYNTYKKSEIERYISSYSSEKYYLEIFEMLENETVFDGFPTINQGTCESCVGFQTCNYEKEMSLFHKLMAKKKGDVS